MSEAKQFEGWAILELMGHRRLGGYVRQEELAGHGFLRIDIPGQCSGAESDRHCEVCGDCKCPNPEESLDDPDCPLHSVFSRHGENVATQYYSPGSVYCLTPTTEKMARAAAARAQPVPVQRWELPSPKPEARDASDDDDVIDPSWDDPSWEPF